MDTGTHNTQPPQIANICLDAETLLGAKSVHMEPTGEGRWWVMVNLPDCSSLTLYIGPDDRLAAALYAAAQKIVTYTLRYEKLRCSRLAVDVSRSKVRVAMDQRAPRSYVVGVEAAGADIEDAIVKRPEVIRGQ